MKLLIDIRILKEGTGGAETFFSNLIEGLAKKIGEDNIILLGCKNNIDFCQKIYPNEFRTVKVPFDVSNPVIRFFSSFLVSLQILANIKEKYVIWHPFNTGAMPFIKAKRKVVTIHDTFVLDRRRDAKGFKYLFRKHDLITTFNYADKVIGISKYTVTQLGNYFTKFSDSKDIVLIRNPIENKTNFDEKSPFEENFPFLLYVGVMRKQKNLFFLIRVFDELRKRKSYSGKLVLAGKVDTVMSSQIMAMIHKLNLEEHIIITGFVNNEELTYLYKNCDLFIFPSIYEGFGYPIVEAIQHGCKIVSSFSASLNEFDNSQITFANPYDHNEFIDAIGNALEKNLLKQEIQNNNALIFERYKNTFFN